MTTNMAFRRAINSLSHPISVAAIIVLLINDHLLRRLWPSWWTGKLGDCVWLVFAPLLLALLLSWFAPSQKAGQERAVGFVAFVLTGLGFTLAKTIPAFAALIIRLLETLTSWPMTLMTDPTDLLALPALGIGWYVWQQKDTCLLQTPYQWITVPLAVLATMANMPAPDYGINCLIEDEGTLIALSQPYRGEYTSQDGGLAWQAEASSIDRELSAECVQHDTTWQISDPADPQVLYRLAPYKTIERSEDGGQSWQREMALDRAEARNAYYRRYRSYSAQPGPLDALFHHPTGQLVVAMGQDGVLVRMTSGEWRWVRVGDYYREDLNEMDLITSLLQGELVLAVFLIPLTAGTIFFPSGQRKWWWYIPPVIAWILWAIPVIFSPALGMTGYGAVYYFPPAFLSIAVAFPWAIYQSVLVYLRWPRGLILVGMIAIGGALLFMLPYLLWIWGAIPLYIFSLGLALFIVVVTQVAGAWYLKRFLAVVEKAQ